MFWSRVGEVIGSKPEVCATTEETSAKRAAEMKEYCMLKGTSVRNEKFKERGVSEILNYILSIKSATTTTTRKVSEEREEGNWGYLNGAHFRCKNAPVLGLIGVKR
jgi:hypothetical protein